MHNRFARLLLLPALPVALVGCDSAIDDEVVVETEREFIVALDSGSVLDASPEDRFGRRVAAPPQDQPGGAASMSELFAWDAPPGWVAQEPSQMRVADFRIGEDGGTECYLAVLSGGGGGVEANLNRWRQQMGLDPVGAEEVAAMPTIPFLGRQAVYVDLAGTYTGLREPAPQPGSRMLGAILATDTFSIFAKLVGPAGQVDREVENFAAFCRSVRPGSMRSGN